MMNFELSEEQKMFRDSVRGFAERHLAAGALARAHEDGFPREVAKMMAEQGLLGITIGEEAGGIGGTLMDAVIAIETVAGICPRSADVIQAGNFGAIRTLAEYADEEQRRRFLTPLLAGEKVITVGMSEPEAGSAVTDLITTATPDGDGYRINGTKVFGTHSAEADYILAYVRFGPSVGGIGSVVIEKGMDGFTHGQPVRYLGGEEWAQLYFDNVYVGPENVILGPGGFKKQIAGFNVERIGNSTRSLALGQLAFDIARDHALERKQFGRPICEFQGLQWMLADMSIGLEAARALVHRAAASAGKDGFPDPTLAAQAKILASETAIWVTNDALQLHGAAGYSRDLPLERMARDARMFTIGGGTAQVLRTLVAGRLLGRKLPQTRDGYVRDKRG